MAVFICPLTVSGFSLKIGKYPCVAAQVRMSKFPDLNKDGKITQADVLMGRGVDLDRDDKAMGSLMVPREGFGIGSIASKAAREVMKKFASRKGSKAADEPADGGVEEGIDIDLEQQEELLSTRNGDALYFSKELLKPKGVLVCKLFMGEDFVKVKDLAKTLFKKVSFFKPESSRKESKETYLHCEILRSL